MPERIQLSRRKGWRLPHNTVKVDRSTLFGNPFIPGQPNGLGYGHIRDAAQAAGLYRLWLVTPPRSITYKSDRQIRILEHLPDLAGKDLACWCRPGAPCHADVLLELANLPGVIAAAQIDPRAPSQWPAPHHPDDPAYATLADFIAALESGADCAELYEIRNRMHPKDPDKLAANTHLIQVGCTNATRHRTDTGGTK